MKKVSKILYRLLIFVYPILMALLFNEYLNGFKVESTIQLLLLLVYTLCLYLFFYIYFGNKVGVYKVTEIVYSNSLGLLITNVLMYIVLLALIRQPFSLFKFILLFIVQVICTCIWTVVSNRIHLSLYGTHRILLIYGKNHNPNHIIQRLRNRKNRFYVKEVMCEDVFDPSRLEEYGTFMLFGVNKEVHSYVSRYCFENCKQVMCVPEIDDLITYGMYPSHIMDTPIFVTKKYPITLDQLLVKRIFDLVCGLIGFVIASPFMLVTAIAIKKEDGGPCLYKQKRLTKDGKEFYVYKFRSMIVDAEKNSGARLSSGENDSRITKVGKVIRAIRFDELPQIFNIIKGDMSIVGPRPERPEIAEQYYKELPEFKYRLKVKAGLTGYAQVYGKYNTTPEDKLKLDLLYINNYSFYQDLKIICYTIKILFMKESTEGVEEGQTTAMSTSKTI